MTATDRLLSYRDVQALTGLSRAAIKRAVKRGDLPRPMHLGSGKSAPARWRESDVLAWLSKPVPVREAELRARAHAPRRGEKERRRAALQEAPPPNGVAPAYAYHAKRFIERDIASRIKRLQAMGVDDRTLPRATGRGKHRRRFPGLQDALAAGWNGGKMPCD
jgi:predicted DNA-binding transcriptional regulator AlpA